MSIYSHPLTGRYHDEEMAEIFADQTTHFIWRRLWEELALAQHQVIPEVIPREAVQDIEQNLLNIRYDRIQEIEKRTRHDVMAHLEHYNEVLKPAHQGLLHLGMTSSFVVDNTWLYQIRQAMCLIREDLRCLVKKLLDIAIDQRTQPMLGYTHMQSAQLTTLGYRVVLWADDLVKDIKEINHYLDNIKFHGIKGATGTYSGMLKLLNGDMEKVLQIEKQVARALGFNESAIIGTQTYSRKTDVQALNILAGISQSASKFAQDIRLLSATGELSERPGRDQVGSSAMPYKANPIQSENICSLARLVQSHPHTMNQTASQQWLERSLDDSAIKRIIVPDSFMATRHILKTYQNIISNMMIHKDQIDDKILDHLAEIMAENVIIGQVRHGISREDIHERLREIYTTAKMTGQKVTIEDMARLGGLDNIPEDIYEQEVWEQANLIGDIVTRSVRELMTVLRKDDQKSLEWRGAE